MNITFVTVMFPVCVLLIVKVNADTVLVGMVEGEKILLMVGAGAGIPQPVIRILSI